VVVFSMWSYSWSDIASTTLAGGSPCHVISLDGISRVLHTDLDKKTVVLFFSLSPFATAFTKQIGDRWSRDETERYQWIPMANRSCFVQSRFREWTIDCRRHFDRHTWFYFFLLFLSDTTWLLISICKERVCSLVLFIRVSLTLIS
jgi:hypothetical protein